MNNSKIKLVVLNNHTLGYILPELPNNVQILHASVLRGAVNCGHSVLIKKSDYVKLASEKDFDEFRVLMDGYKKDLVYEYLK